MDDSGRPLSHLPLSHKREISHVESFAGEEWVFFRCDAHDCVWPEVMDGCDRCYELACANYMDWMYHDVVERPIYVI